MRLVGNIHDTHGSWHRDMMACHSADAILQRLQDMAGSGQATKWRIVMARQRLHDLIDLERAQGR